MKIKFYAHACFRLEGSGLSFITDPYTPAISGFAPVGETCDVVLMSSATDRFHSDASQVPGRPTIIDAMTITPHGTVIRGVRIQSFPNRENKLEEAADNAMYYLTLDGIRLLHMGDAGWAPDSDTVHWLKDRVDILFALTGGLPTIPLDDLQTMIATIRPRVVIPMHYFTPKGVLKILPVTDFTDRYPRSSVTWHTGPVIEFDAATLPDPTQIIVLEQSR